MKIQITETMRPFSHLPGASALLPKSLWKVTAFPALLVLQGPCGEKITICLQLAEKMSAFVLFLDLMRGEIEMSGRVGAEFLRLIVKVEEKKICLEVKKAPKNGVACRLKTQVSTTLAPDSQLFSGQKFYFIVDLPDFPCRSLERLSLGVHKKQDIDLIRRRGDLKEILPLWFLLSQWLSFPPTDRREGIALLLGSCEEKKDKENIMGMKKDLHLLWESGFSSLFVPRLVDESHLGPFEEYTPSSRASAFVLVSDGAKIIRSLFFEQKANELHLLPHLLPSFISGRLTNIQCDSLGLLDMEWRGKMPRRVSFSARKTAKLQLIAPKEIKTFRMRRSMQDRGSRVANGATLSVEEKNCYFFDRFEK